MLLQADKALLFLDKESPAGGLRRSIRQTDTICLCGAGRPVRHDLQAERANNTRPQSKRGSFRATTHGQGQRYSRIERPQSIVRRTHQHGPGLDSRGAVPAAVRKPTFLF